MATRSFAPLLGKRLRITRLDDCGRPMPPGTPNSQIVTDGFITIKLSAETEDGSEIIQRKANGQLCINEKFSDSFKHLGVEAEFCGVNPSLLALTTNAEEYKDWEGVVNGVTISDGDITGKFALELWTGLANSECGDGADEASGYILLPFVNVGILDDLEIGGEDAITFSIKGAFTKGGNAWGTGPYSVTYNVNGDAAKLPTALESGTHFLLMDTGLAAPPVAEDMQPMPLSSTPGATTTTTTTAAAWKASTAYVVGASVVVGSATLQAVTAGTSAATAPTAPAAVNGTVTDGSVTWKRTA